MDADLHIRRRVLVGRGLTGEVGVGGRGGVRLSRDDYVAVGRSTGLVLEVEGLGTERECRV